MHYPLNKMENNNLEQLKATVNNVKVTVWNALSTALQHLSNHVEHLVITAASFFSKNVKIQFYITFAFFMSVAITWTVPSKEDYILGVLSSLL